MKKALYLLFFIAVSYQTTAQITYIPDPNFEQALISLTIDSDGIINGQVLTSDVENVTELNLYNEYGINDLAGIQDFTALEVLNLNHNLNLTTLDVSNNLALRVLNISQNSITEVDLSYNTLLEELYCGNPTDDVWPQNEITHIDLSNNPNIHTVFAENMGHSLKWINLNNDNNNSNTTIDISIIFYGMGDDPDYDPNDIYNTVCIEVDDENLAQNNQYPYSNWDITHYHTAYIFTNDAVQCTLSTLSFSQSNIKVYPNPVSDILYFDSDNSVIEKIILFDLSGRKILEQNEVNSISVAHLQKGNYILKIFSDKGVQTEKVIIN